MGSMRTFTTLTTEPQDNYPRHKFAGHVLFPLFYQLRIIFQHETTNSQTTKSDSQGRDIDMLLIVSQRGGPVIKVLKIT